MHEKDPASPAIEGSSPPGGRPTEGSGPAQGPARRPVTIGQVQRILEMRLGFTVSINTLERWCRQGKIYAVRLGYEWRIPREAVEQLIKVAQLGERF